MRIKLRLIKSGKLLILAKRGKGNICYSVVTCFSLDFGAISGLVLFCFTLSWTQSNLI